MADTSATDSSGDGGRAGDTSVLEDLIGLIPRLADRTSAQVQFSRSLLSMLPCPGRLFTAPVVQDEVAAPQHEARQPTDVLSVLASEPDAQPPEVHNVSGTAETAPDTPPAEDLAIPDYDSLAASQVVPRLTTLSVQELGSVRAYESANRNRRTILNRVTALLAD